MESKKDLVFCLKVNRDSDYTIKSLRHWINICTSCAKPYVIICDNQTLLNKINREIKFTKYFLGIQPSYKQELGDMLKNIVQPYWLNCAIAHLSTFYYATKNGYNNFWNIDADDTMFCIEANIAANILIEAKEYADSNNIDCFSLDMWASKTRGVHWSFGITYIKNDIDYFDILNNIKDMRWTYDYLDYSNAFNLDWLFTHLGNIGTINTQSFYIEDVYFVHWGSFVLNPSVASICYWKDKEVHFPLFKGFISGYGFDVIPILETCIKLDVDMDLTQSLNFLFCKIAHIGYFARELIRSHKLDDFIDTFGAIYDKNLLSPESKKPAPTPPLPIKEKKVKFLGIPLYERKFDSIRGIKEWKILGFRHPFRNSISKFFDKILSKIPDEFDDIYLIRQSTGEAYLIANMVHKILESNGSKNPAFFFTRKFHFDFFELYADKRYNYFFEYISPIDFPYFNKYRYKYKGRNIYICLDHAYLLENAVFRANTRGRGILNYTAQIAKYFNVKDYEKCFKYPNIADRYKTFAREYLKKFNINDNKFVVLYNKSGTVAQLDSSFWRYLEEQLKANNIKYIYNNQKLNFKEMTAICENALAIIACRTGSIESLVPLNKKMFILYSYMPRFGFDAEVAMELYTIKKYPMAKSSNIFEYDTQKDTHEYIISNILDNIKEDISE